MSQLVYDVTLRWQPNYTIKYVLVCFFFSDVLSGQAHRFGSVREMVRFKGQLQTEETLNRFGG